MKRFRLTFLVPGLLLLAALPFLALGACSARIAAKIAAKGAAEIEVRAGLPASIATKLRALGNLPEGSPIFDVDALRASLLARPGVVIRSIAAPTPDSLALAFTVADLGKALAPPDGAGPGLIVLRDAGWEKVLAIRIARGQGAALAALAPGLDPDLLETLSPPALGESDLSKAEYRQALGGIVGSKLLPELDAASIDCVVALPGAIVSRRGGTVEGSGWKLSIPLLDLLVLEKPVDLEVRWKP